MDRIIGLTLHSAALWFFLLSNVAAQSTIHTARQSAIGTAITVQGVVLNGEELGPIRYVQDSTGGIGVYPGNGSVPAFSGANPGDIIRVSGTLTSYRGLLEINPVTAYEAISEGNALPVPKSITLAELGPGNEGELIKISCVQWTSETTFAGGEILVSDEEGTTSTVYFRGGHPLIGQPVPAPAMDIIGISSRFDTPQILPRSQNDFTPAAMTRTWPRSSARSAPPTCRPSAAAARTAEPNSSASAEMPQRERLHSSWSAGCRSVALRS